MTDVVVTKWCSGHQTYHPVDDFGGDKHRPDGLNGRCKAYLRGLKIDREAARRRMAKYNASPKGRARSERYKAVRPDAEAEKQRRYRQRHPELVTDRTKLERVVHRDRVLARKAVHTALTRGKIIRPTACASCGRTCKPQAHHDDYSRRLDVRWLCARCHKLTHLEAPCRMSA